MYDNLRVEFDKLKQSTIQPSRIDSFPIQKGRVQPVFSEPSGFEDLPSRHHAGPGPKLYSAMLLANVSMIII
jgi:hypothetical protein